MRRNKSPRSSNLSQWLRQFPHLPILIVGDLMVDRSYRGPAERISPEAPVPVVHAVESNFTPGGAGNVANNLAVLGAKTTLVSVRGEDMTGKEIELDLKGRGIDVSYLFRDPQRPTITKNRVFAGHQQVARFDFEKRTVLSDGLQSQLLKALATLVPKQKAIIISDYGKGIITPGVIKACLNAARRYDIPVIVDPKVEHFMQYKGVDCITPNTKEAVEGMRALPPKSEQEVLTLGNKILNKLKCRSLLITRGEKGMTLFQKGTPPQTIPTMAQEVYDVTGAGDTVVSVFSLARAAGAPYLEAARLANFAASVVVAKVGTAVVTREELAERIRRSV